MKISIYQKLLFLTFIILVGNGIIGFALYKSNQKRLDAEQWVQHTEQVIYQTGKILLLGIDLETASRGFIITNDSTFLEPLYAAKKKVFTYIGQLRQLTKDNPEQQLRIDSLDYYIHKRLDFTLQSVELRSKKGLAPAIAYTSTRQGRQYTDRIRQITDTIQNEEVALLKQRKLTNEFSLATFNLVLMGVFLSMGIFTILLLVAFSKILFKNEEKEKRAAELIIANKELAFQNEEKEKRAAELIIANKELAFQNEEKEKRAAELIIAKVKAEESERLKSAFLANMSHEIRTPMNSIMGFTELLKNPYLEEEKQQKYIKMIEQGGERMLNILNDLIDLSKIQSGQTKVFLSACNINENIEYIYTFFKPEVERKGMHFSFLNSLPEKEAVIITDKEKIYAILSNLVKNAIKYSNHGTIEIGYYFNPVSKPDVLTFFVKDTGIGISRDKIEFIFDRFVQVNGNDNRIYHGVGLGLSIAKAYVEMLNGKLWVESEIGKGSTFYFTIPYHNVPEEIIATDNIVFSEETEYRIKKLKILIVEDDESSALLETEILKKHCRELLYATSGDEAVKACSKHPDIDLVLIDINMPVMNGCAATRQIRKFNNDVVIIAQSAHVLSVDKEKAMEAGCNDYISKPLNKAILFDLLKKYFLKL